MKDLKLALKEMSLPKSIALVVDAVGLNEGLLLKAQLEKLERDNALGILSREDYALTWNQILHGWHYTVDKLSNDQLELIAANSYLHIHAKQVAPKLRVASTLLRTWKSDFGYLSNSHIERPETAQLLAWIDAPLVAEQKGIALLVGNPGMGKSVVMGDVLRELEARSIPVLGLKADQDCAENLSELSKRLELDEGIVPTIQVLAQSEERVVLLVDQIDALSQSLSVKREYLNTFTRLVHALEELSNVRIIVSCRTYDLQNDQAFNFYQNQKKIILGKLEEEEVKSVLQKLTSTKLSLSKELMELLQTPLHLNVFCRIYRSGLAFIKFKALRDLYEELWVQKIMTPTVSNINPQRCADLIAEMSRMMYERQSLSLAPTLFRQDYAQELIQLQSNGIILPSSHDELVFFHQTFYEFAFAKQFVARRIPVEQYLEENEQNLHIRACLKMILEFLRESDPKEYLRVNHTILTSPNIYFHIKSLALSVMGFANNPSSKEMELVRDCVFPDFALFKTFISSVRSRKWLLFLLENRQLQQLIEPIPTSSETTLEGVAQERYQSRVNILNGLLQRHLSDCQVEVFSFLEELPDFAFKAGLVESTLYQIEPWNHPSSFKLFDAYQDKISDFTSFRLLRKAAITRLDWAIDHLKNIVEKVVQAKRKPWREIEFEYDTTQLIKYFIENYPEQTFDLLFGFQLQQLRTPEEMSGTDNSGSSINNDCGFLGLDIDEKRDRDHTALFYLLVYCARTMAKNRSPRFAQFIQQTIDSNSTTLLLVMVEGFRANTSAYALDINQFISIFLQKRGFDANAALDRRTRQLLQESYSNLSKIQQGQIIQLVSEIESERDQTFKEENPEWVGIERFRWFQCIPEKDLAQIPMIEYMANELKARFPGLEKESHSRSGFRAVGPPMPKPMYDELTLADWKDSFLKFNQDYQREIGSGEGGMEQHAQQFEKKVKEHPQFFFPLIEELTTDQSFPITYLVNGLDGLRAAEYSPEQLLHLFKKIDYNNWNDWEIIRLVSLCGYFINARIEDDYFFHFLINVARTHPDPKDDTLRLNVDGDRVESIIGSGFNTVRGSAVHLLPYCYYFKHHESLLFETLEQVAKEDILAVRCQMIPRLSALMILDGPRTTRLFLHLIRSGEEAVMKHSALPAQHLAWQDFEGMKPYFEEALKHPNLHHDLGIILSLIWVFERADALDWLNQFITISDEAIAGAIEVAAHNIRDEKERPIARSIELFQRFLMESSERIGHAYHSAFHQLKPADFPHIQLALVRYAQSDLARKNPGAFYEYLISCAQEYPAECLELVKDFDQYERPDMRYSGHYDNEPLQVVLNAYHALWGKKVKKKEDIVLLKKALLLFDRMLLDERFYHHADKALDLIEQ